MSRAKEIYELFKDAKIVRGDSSYEKETEEDILKWQRQMDELNRDTKTVAGCYDRILDELEMRIKAYKNSYTDNVSNVVLAMVPTNVIREVEKIFKSEQGFEVRLENNFFGESLVVNLVE